MPGEPPCRRPAVEHPEEYCDEQLAADLLPHEAPYAHAAQSHAYADRPAGHRSYQRHLRLRLEVHPLGQGRPLDDRRGVDDHYHRHRPDERHQPGLVEEPAHRSRRDYHHPGHQQAQHHVEDKGGVVVCRVCVLLAYQRVRESAVDDAVQDDHDDRYVADEPVLLRGEEPREHQADEEGDALSGDAVYAAPDGSAYGLGFQ